MNKTKLLSIIATMSLVAACAFVLAACQNNTAAKGSVAATVNGTSIYEDTVTETIQTVRAQAGLDTEEAWGEFLASSEMTPESVREQIINSLIDQELLKQGAAELGVTVDSAQVDSYVEMMRANFDSDDAWKTALSDAGFTEEEYRENIEASLLSQAVGAYFEENANISDEEVLESAKTYVTYYDGAKRSSHILFKVDDTTDEAAMAAAREEAQGVLDQINAGTLDFAAAAQQYSDDSSKDNGGDVGWDVTTTFVTAYQTALDGLELNQVSDLVESEYGIHIIKCTEIFTAPAELTSLDQIPAEFQETIKSMAASMSANTAYTEWLDGLRENADIQINDMPADVPYNIDMSKYTTESASAEAASTEAASTESASTESASTEAASTEAASTEAASTESASTEAASSDASASASSESAAS